MWKPLVVAALLVWPHQEPPSGAEASPAPRPTKAWVGRYAEFEDFIRTSPIERLEDIPVGVLKPKRGFFTSGGLAASVIVKSVRRGRVQGYWESYQSEIAAYELDKLLGLEMVPVTVEKRVQGELVSAQLWVEGCTSLKKLKDVPNPDVSGWNRQVYRQRVFDNLIANIDRNEGNLLVARDPNWTLILVDHSRAFTSEMKMPFPMTRIDRPLFARLRLLDEKALRLHVGRLVLDGGRSLLKRRDAIVAHFEKLAAEKGESEVFIP